MSSGEQIDAFAPTAWAMVDAGTDAQGEAHRVPVRAHVRRVKGAAPPTGDERKKAALDKHVEDTSKSLALAYIRNELQKLWRQRHADYLSRVSELPEERVTVDADDAARILHEWAECPPEVRALKTKAFLGAVFRKGWKHVGYTKSARASNNRCILQTWRLTDG